MYLRVCACCPTCVGMHANRHVSEVRTCPQISKVLTKHPSTRHSPPPSRVHRVDWERPGGPWRLWGREEALNRPQTEGSCLPAVSRKPSSVIAALLAAFICSSYRSKVPSAVKCTPQSWKILAVYQTSMRQSSKPLHGNKTWRVSFYIIS